jgi:hypothetical protein
MACASTPSRPCATHTLLTSRLDRAEQAKEQTGPALRAVEQPLPGSIHPSLSSLAFSHFVCNELLATAACAGPHSCGPFFIPCNDLKSDNGARGQLRIEPVPALRIHPPLSWHGAGADAHFVHRQPLPCANYETTS